MKISIKEIKVENDGCELLYVRDIGLILKSETFSGESISIEALIPELTQIISVLSKSKGESEPSEKIEVEKQELKKEE